MIKGVRLFENFYDDTRIINTRLYNFSNDTRNRLIAANGSGDYTTLISQITPLILNFGNEIGDVDVALNLQKGTTLTVDQFIAGFKLTMSLKEGVIADALGGFGTPEYLEFYPHGLTEYSHATKTEMPVLVNRVNVAATDNSGALSPTLVTQLQGFETTWGTVRNNQETQIGNVSDQRTERTAARLPLELGMLTVVHTIAAMFPGDVEQCLSFFHFALLFPQTHHAHRILSGTLPKNSITVIANLTFTDTMKLRIRNTDSNADFKIYLALNATDEPGSLAKLVKPNRGIRPMPSQLGDLANTFLLIKNISTVNDGSYIVDISGAD